MTMKKILLLCLLSVFSYRAIRAAINCSNCPLITTTCPENTTPEVDCENCKVNCIDVDECTEGTHNCTDVNSQCHNTVGSFYCSCESGYTGNGQTCSDVNECVSGTHNCGQNSECVNNEGSFTCKCKVGYTGDGSLCDDINECTSGTHSCHSSKADCSNTDGSYSCSCKTGFRGDGRTCYDVNECSSNTDYCHYNAYCFNTDGSYRCYCRSGYNGDGTTCSDIDECSTGDHNCDGNAECRNTDGSYSCHCRSGYSGNGRSCSRRRSSSCFPGHAKVNEMKKGPIKMQALQIGDKILSVTDEGQLLYSDVIGWLDRKEDLTSEFYEIQTTTGDAITLTGDHLIFKTSPYKQKRESVFASHLNLGDYILTQAKPSDSNVKAIMVTNITKSAHLGIYAPLTREGTVLVNSIAASCYAAVNDHALAHAALYPIRVVDYFVPSANRKDMGYLQSYLEMLQLTARIVMKEENFHSTFNQ